MLFHECVSLNSDKQLLLFYRVKPRLSLSALNTDSSVSFADHFFFHLSLVAFLSHLHLSFSPVSLCRLCSPPFILSLTFRGIWQKSNCPTQLVCLLSYLHHATVCVRACVHVCFLRCVWPRSKLCSPVSCPPCSSRHLATSTGQISAVFTHLKKLWLFLCVWENKQHVHPCVLQITWSTWAPSASFTTLLSEKRSIS